MKRTVTDILVSITKSFIEFKAEGKTKITTNQLREKTGLISYNTEKYLDYFQSIDKIDITTSVDNRGVNRLIDLTKFDLTLK